MRSAKGEDKPFHAVRPIFSVFRFITRTFPSAWLHQGVRQTAHGAVWPFDSSAFPCRRLRILRRKMLPAIPLLPAYDCIDVSACDTAIEIHCEPEDVRRRGTPKFLISPISPISFQGASQTVPTRLYANSTSARRRWFRPAFRFALHPLRRHGMR